MATIDRKALGCTQQKKIDVPLQFGSTNIYREPTMSQAWAGHEGCRAETLYHGVPAVHAWPGRPGLPSRALVSLSLPHALGTRRLGDCIWLRGVCWVGSAGGAAGGNSEGHGNLTDVCSVLRTCRCS